MGRLCQAGIISPARSRPRRARVALKIVRRNEEIRSGAVTHARGQLSSAPVAQNAMARCSSDVIGCCRDEFSPPQMCERRMHGAFGESGCVCDRAHTGADGAPFVSCGLAVKM